MTNFWRLVFLSIIWSWARLCDTLVRIREDHWLLRLILSFSESMSEYESVFRTCVWIISHVIINLIIWLFIKTIDWHLRSYCFFTIQSGNYLFQLTNHLIWFTQFTIFSTKPKKHKKHKHIKSSRLRSQILISFMFLVLFSKKITF